VCVSKSEHASVVFGVCMCEYKGEVEVSCT
jgi:hypothetical protein